MTVKINLMMKLATFFYIAPNYMSVFQIFEYEAAGNGFQAIIVTYPKLPNFVLFGQVKVINEKKEEIGVCKAYVLTCNEQHRNVLRL